MPLLWFLVKMIGDFELFEEKCRANDLKIVLTRDVPIDRDALGEYALESLPKIRQLSVVPDSIMSFSRFECNGSI